MAIEAGNIIEWKDIISRLKNLLVNIADNIPTMPDISAFKSVTLLRKSFPTDHSKKTATRIVKQVGVTISETAVSVETLEKDINELFTQNQYVIAPNTTVVAVDDMYNIAYVIENYLKDSLTIYASTYYNKKLVMYHSASKAYGKPVIVDKNYTIDQFNNFINNLGNIINSIQIKHTTYTRRLNV